MTADKYEGERVLCCQGTRLSLVGATGIGAFTVHEQPGVHHGYTYADGDPVNMTDVTGRVAERALSTQLTVTFSESAGIGGHGVRHILGTVSREETEAINEAAVREFLAEQEGAILVNTAWGNLQAMVQGVPYIYRLFILNATVS